MDEKIGLIVKAKINIYPDTSIGDDNNMIKAGDKGMVYSILPENYHMESDSWFIIFQSGEATDFNNYERERYLEITEDRVSGSDRNRIHNKKMNEVVEDIKKKRLKL